MTAPLCTLCGHYHTGATCGFHGCACRGKKRARWGTAAGLGVSLHVRNVPPDVRAQFKGYCARRGYTLEATIIALMRRAIQKNETIPEARKKKAATIL